MIRVALAQLDLVVGDLARNAERIADACADAARQDADLVLAPELAISGYPPEDLLFRPAFLDACRRQAEALAGQVDVPLLVGCPWLEGDRVRNSALLLSGGDIVARYDKQELPNYGVFDEERTFDAGRRTLVVGLRDAKCGVTICEDIWLPDGPGHRAARGGATVVLNISASPYYVGKADVREEMLRTRARDERAAIVFCNLVGGQDELVFDGRSVVIDPDGDVLARAPAFDEALLLCDVDPREAVESRLRDSRPRRGRRSRAAREPELVLPAGPEPELPLRGEVTPPPASAEEELWRALVCGLRDYVEKNGFGKVLVSISGGIDSALVAALAADALGPDRVEGVSLPTRYNVEETRSDARQLAEGLGIGFRELPIEDLRVHFEQSLPGLAGLAAENLQARIRAVIVMGLSNQHGWLVLTTSNKSETAVGDSTLYGDSAGGFAPIRDVPKTRVFALARWLNHRDGRETIPVSTIERPPSAELREDQRDDQALPPYEQLDPILEAYVERDLSPAEIARLGLGDLATAQRIARLVDGAEFKRRQAPPGLKLHPKAFGRDRRVPITNRFVS